MTIPRRWSALLIPLIAGALLGGAPPAAAQCFGPDGLDIGPCCAPALPDPAALPGASLPGPRHLLGPLHGTSSACSRCPGPRRPSPCGEYTTPLTVVDRHLRPADPDRQDACWTTRARGSRSIPRASPRRSGASPRRPICRPCPARPAALPDAQLHRAGRPAPHRLLLRLRGLLGLRGRRARGERARALPRCDRFIHAPGLSDKPGVFHPGQSFAIVAPHSTRAALHARPTHRRRRPARRRGHAHTSTCRACRRRSAWSRTASTQGAHAPAGRRLREHHDHQPQAADAAALHGHDLPAPTRPACPAAGPRSTSTSRRCRGSTWSPRASARGPTPTSTRARSSPGWMRACSSTRTRARGDLVELKYGGSTPGGWTALLPVAGGRHASFTDIADNYTAPLPGPYPAADPRQHPADGPPDLRERAVAAHVGNRRRAGGSGHGASGAPRSWADRARRLRSARCASHGSREASSPCRSSQRPPPRSGSPARCRSGSPATGRSTPRAPTTPRSPTAAATPAASRRRDRCSCTSGTPRRRRRTPRPCAAATTSSCRPAMPASRPSRAPCRPTPAASWPASCCR